MRVFIINSFFSVGGPPRIVKGIYDTLIENGDECIVAAGREKPIPGMNVYKIGSPINKYWHYMMSVLFDAQGFSSVIATKKLIDKIKDYNPDVINIHNLHGHYINIKILFNYLGKANIPVVWTLHDCWSFTGHCCNFEYVACDKWKSEGCHQCNQFREYPKSLFLDRSNRNYTIKKQLINRCSKLCIVTPSEWLASLVSESYLSGYKIQVIHNGIDLDLFKPTYVDIKNKYNISGRIILGVAQNWGMRKGLDDFIKLRKLIDDSFIIILVGLTDKQIIGLPSGIIGLEKTNDLQELLELYTAADMFVNPTLEDNFPTVNIESLACGTPVITYNTGGSPEAVDQTCGIVLNNKTPESIADAIIKNIGSFAPETCIKRAQLFDRKDKYREYITLFTKLL